MNQPRRTALAVNAVRTARSQYDQNSAAFQSAAEVRQADPSLSVSESEVWFSIYSSVLEALNDPNPKY